MVTDCSVWGALRFLYQPKQMDRPIVGWTPPCINGLACSSCPQDSAPVSGPVGHQQICSGERPAEPIWVLAPSVHVGVLQSTLIGCCCTVHYCARDKSLSCATTARIPTGYIEFLAQPWKESLVEQLGLQQSPRLSRHNEEANLQQTNDRRARTTDCLLTGAEKLLALWQPTNFERCTQTAVLTESTERPYCFFTHKTTQLQLSATFTTKEKADRQPPIEYNVKTEQPLSSSLHLHAQLVDVRYSERIPKIVP